jgi:pentatricopeptide repeat protein
MDPQSTAERRAVALSDDGGLQRRNAALGRIGAFKAALDHVRSKRDARLLTAGVRDDLAALQRRQADRTHLAKSVCQIATALRHQGWPDLGEEILEWAIDRSAVDEYVLAELLQCRVRQGRLDDARKVLARARGLGLAGPIIYSALIDGLGRAHRLELARQTLEEARMAGLDNIGAYTTLIASYGRDGQLQGARALLDLARRQYGWRPRPVTAMVNAYGRAGAVASAQALFDEALVNGAVDKRTCTALMSAYGTRGDLGRAAQIFDLAVARGLADARSRTTLLSFYDKRRQPLFLPAERRDRGAEGGKREQREGA